MGAPLTRDVIGQFTAHTFGDPETFLLAENSPHTVTVGREQDARLDRFEQSYAVTAPYLRPGAAGSLTATFVGESDDFLYEVTLDADGQATDANLLEFSPRSGLLNWVPLTFSASEDVYSDPDFNLFSGRPHTRSVTPSLAQSPVLTAFTDNELFRTSVRAMPGGTTSILSTSVDGKRVVRGTVDAAGTLLTAAEYVAGVDEELYWREMRPYAIKRLARHGIPA